MPIEEEKSLKNNHSTDIGEEEERKSTYNSYLLFFTGQIFSIFGSSIAMFVIIWHLTDIVGENNTILSLAFFSGLLPIVILSPIAGVIADKYNKKIIIILADSLQAFLTLGLIFIFYFGTVQVWHILTLNSLRSVCQAFHVPITYSLIPQMVPKEKLSRINGINILFISIVEIIGPVVGAWLMVFFDTGHILWIDIITFGLALITILQIKFPQRSKKEIPINVSQENGNTQSKQTFFAQMKEGFTTIREIPGFMSMIFIAVVINFFSQPLYVLLPNFIKYGHLGSKQNLGYFMGFLELGVLIGGLIASIKKKWNNIILIISIGFYSGGIMIILLGLVPEGNFILLYIIAFFVYIPQPITNSLVNSSIQIKVPPEKMARVISIIVSLAYFTSPLGMLLSGLIADAIGSISSFYILCGILRIIIITLLLYSKKNIIFLRTMQQEQDEIHNK